MRTFSSGARVILLITLFLVWSVVGLVVAAMVIWTEPPTIAWVGLVVPVAVATGLSAAAWALLPRETPGAPLPSSERAATPPGVHRILVVANESLEGRPLHDEVARRARERPTEVLVVAPALSGPVAHWTDAEDMPRRAAAERVERTCAALGDLGVATRGAVGTDDPVRAVEDALRTFGADEIVISTHPPGASGWLEEGAVERLRAFYDIPVVHIVVERETAPGRAAA